MVGFVLKLNINCPKMRDRDPHQQRGRHISELSSSKPAPGPGQPETLMEPLRAPLKPMACQSKSQMPKPFNL